MNNGQRKAFINARLIDPSTGLDQNGAILVDRHMIADSGPSLFADGVPDGVEAIDCAGQCLAPGLIDMRVFIGEPGAEHKETLATASEAAAVGGVTTIAMMPETDPVIDDVALVEFVARQARENAVVSILPTAAITKGLAGNEMTEMGLLQAAGAVALTDGTRAVSDALVMRRVLSYASSFEMLIMQHAAEPSLTANGCMNEGEVSTLLNKVDVSPQGMARRWHNLYPRVKVLIVIRDQVAWLDSLYRYSASELPRGKRSFEDFCASPRGAVVLRAGMYDLTIQAYLDVFGARQVKVLRYEDLSLDHDKFMTELCEYVGVDWIKTANEPLNVGRSSAAAFLIAHFGFLDKIPPSVRAIGRMALAVFGKNSMFGLSRKEQRLIRSFYRLSNLRTEKILSGQAEEL